MFDYAIGRKSSRNELLLAIHDFSESVRLWRLALYLGVDDILRQYRRSVLGAFWPSISTAVFIFAFSFIGSEIFRIDMNVYLAYFCVSHVCFLLISQIISDSCQVFISSANFLKSTYMPKLIFVMRMLIRNIVQFMMNLPVLIFVLIFFGNVQEVKVAEFLGSFSIVVFLGLFIGCFVGSICARFRDVPLIVENVMKIAFFLTPVLWQPNQVGSRGQLLVALNPLAALLDSLRAPLLGQSVSSSAIFMLQLLIPILFLFGLFSFVYSRRRICYWV